jgi:hypothetical protein
MLSLHLELQHGRLHVLTVIARLIGKFQVSHESSHIYVLLQDLDVTDSCSQNCRLQMSPAIKIYGIKIKGMSRPRY